MPAAATTRPSRGTARTKLLDAAVAVVRAQGLNATTVDDLCAEAGVTKGAFFHHFASKEELAVEAARHWSETTGAMFDAADYHRLEDPLDRVLGYLDLRAQLIRGGPAEFSCLAGTMVQESFDTAPAVRDACGASILGHAATLTDDIAAAVRAHPPVVPVDPASLARHTQAVLQGAFVLAKAADDPAVALESVEHLRRYVELLFDVRQTDPPHDKEPSP